jgi:hypothetical protein|tara:strand:- start:197 stop:376 length:180 start_codon:yes stop_codon:yes gene_type:complete
MSEIKTVTKQPTCTDDTKFNYIIIYNDGKEWTVPHDESNRMYQEILEWVAQGNTIGEPN